MPGIGVRMDRTSLELRVEGMDCADCALKLEQAVSRLDGAFHVSVNFAAATMHVEDRKSVV